MAHGDPLDYLWDLRIPETVFKERKMDDITAKRIESKLDRVLAILDEPDTDHPSHWEESERLRAGLNNLVGAIINKKIAGLDDELEAARAVLEARDE